MRERPHEFDGASVKRGGFLERGDEGVHLAAKAPVDLFSGEEEVRWGGRGYGKVGFSLEVLLGDGFVGLCRGSSKEATRYTMRILTFMSTILTLHFAFRGGGRG